jgi:hypothetical protein
MVGVAQLLRDLHMDADTEVEGEALAVTELLDMAEPLLLGQKDTA